MFGCVILIKREMALNSTPGMIEEVELLLCLKINRGLSPPCAMAEVIFSLQPHPTLRIYKLGQLTECSPEVSPSGVTEQ